MLWHDTRRLNMTQASPTCLPIALGNKVVVTIDRNMDIACTCVAAPLSHMATLDGGVVAPIKRNNWNVQWITINMPARGTSV